LAKQGLGWGNEVAWELLRSGREALVREVGDGDDWKGKLGVGANGKRQRRTRSSCSPRRRDLKEWLIRRRMLEHKHLMACAKVQSAALPLAHPLVDMMPW
jgi:hypothetical protein